MNDIAVILSVYKTAEVASLAQALESLKLQTYKKIKVFICIDGIVSDGVDDLLYEFEFNKKIIKNAESKGLATSLNLLIHLVLNDPVDFKYIARMDEDDIAIYNRIEKQVQFMEENPNIDASGSSIVEIDNFGVDGKIRTAEINYGKMIQKFGYKTPIFHPTSIFKTSLFQNQLSYNSKTDVPEDLYLWGVLISKGYTLGNTEEVLLKYRVSNKTALARLRLKGSLTLFLFRFRIMYRYGKINILSVFLSLFRYFLSCTPKLLKIIIYKYYS